MHDHTDYQRLPPRATQIKCREKHLQMSLPRFTKSDMPVFSIPLLLGQRLSHLKAGKSPLASPSPPASLQDTFPFCLLHVYISPDQRSHNVKFLNESCFLFFLLFSLSHNNVWCEEQKNKSLVATYFQTKPIPGYFIYDYPKLTCWVWALEVKLEKNVKLIPVYTPH